MHTEKMMNYVKAAGADALLLLDEADMHYVCGFSPSEGMILVTPTAVFHWWTLAIQRPPGSTRRTPACR